MAPNKPKKSVPYSPKSEKSQNSFKLPCAKIFKAPCLHCLDLGAAQSSIFGSEFFRLAQPARAENYGSTAIMHPKLMHAPRAGGSTPVPPVGGGSHMLRGLMLRDLALLLVNRPKKNIYIFS